eukprot:116931-Amphidinium_carterae.1
MACAPVSQRANDALGVYNPACCVPRQLPKTRGNEGFTLRRTTPFQESLWSQSPCRPMSESD